MQSVLDLKSRAWQPENGVSDEKNEIKFRNAKRMSLILKSLVTQDLDACHGRIN